MRGLWKWLAVALAFGALTSVARGEGVAPTVEWYVAHPEERAQLLSVCRSNPGYVRENSVFGHSCVAAWEANIVEAQQEAERAVDAIDAMRDAEAPAPRLNPAPVPIPMPVPAPLAPPSRT